MEPLKDRILCAVDVSVDHWCTNCPDAIHCVASITGPEEWICSRKLSPGDELCRRRLIYEDIMSLAGQIEELVEHGEVV